MTGGEDQVDLQMTVAAGILIERHGEIIDMTVCTGKGTSIRVSLVRGQFERGGVVVKHSRRPSAWTVTGSAACAECA